MKKNSYLNHVVKIFGENKNEEESFLTFENYLSKLYHSTENSEFVNYLFRAFMIATVANKLNATALFTSSRKPIGALIRKRNHDILFQTLPYKIYRYANAIFLNHQRNLFFQNRIRFYSPLLFCIMCEKTDDKSKILEKVFQLRSEFENYRRKIWKKTIQTSSASSRKKYLSMVKKTESYYNERGRLLSDNSYRNMFTKIGKEIFLDNAEVKFEYEPNDNNDNNEKITSSFNLITIAKNSLKIITDLSKFEALRRLNKPLGSYLCNLMKKESIPTISNFIKVDEYYYQRMRSFDRILRKQNI